jgi:hypothetical protein
MPSILNFSTKVPAARTVSEICQLLARKGARSVSQTFGETGKVTAISFRMPVGGFDTDFQLPLNVAGVLQAMQKGAEPRYRTREQAERVSWRILKDWCEAQIALVESNQAEMAQVFMPYAMVEGQTMYKAMIEANVKRLGAGGVRG